MLPECHAFGLLRENRQAADIFSLTNAAAYIKLVLEASDAGARPLPEESETR